MKVIKVLGGGEQWCLRGRRARPQAEWAGWEGGGLAREAIIIVPTAHDVIPNTRSIAN